MPKTTLGKWSIGLIVAAPVLFMIGRLSLNLLYESVPSGDTMLEDIAQRPVLALNMLSGIASGVIAFFVGLVSINKHKERSILVYGATILGGLLTLLLIGEIIFPH